jgi:hypothetical protein
MVEAAFVLPIALFIMIALIVGALGVFRYQETAYLAREGARYLSTHGANFRKDAGWSVGTPALWTSDMMTNCINKEAVILDPAQLTVTVSWPPVAALPAQSDNWPGSKVKVTVQYNWLPETTKFPAATFTSVAEQPITN